MITWSMACSAAEPGLTPAFDGRDAARQHIAVKLVPLVRGVPQITDVAPVPGSDAIVVLSKGGTAYLARPGSEPAPWFQVDVATDSELGLLGIAFAPDFATSGAFVVHLNPKDELRTVLRRGHADPATLSGATLGEVLLEQTQPRSNHNGGQIAFGPEGALYVGLGDGGGSGDPDGNGQDVTTLLGKILRLAVPPTGPAVAYPGNPLVRDPKARPEIWATGLRNPWRFTFDPLGNLIVADVGQNEREEIDWVKAGDNLGWSLKEADRCFHGQRCVGPFVDPIWVYGHDEGISVTGGVVVTADGPLRGRYLFADFGTGRVWALSLPAVRGRVQSVAALGRFDVHPSAFARGPSGEAWIADYSGGVVYRVVPE